MFLLHRRLALNSGKSAGRSFLCRIAAVFAEPQPQRVRMSRRLMAIADAFEPAMLLRLGFAMAASGSRSCERKPIA